MLFSLLTAAVESTPTTIFVTSTDGGNGPGTLNEALQNVVDDTIIDCSPIAGQTIFLNTGGGGVLPAIGHNHITLTPTLTILGHGVTIDGGNVHPAFALGQGSATITNFTIQNTRSLGGPGGVGLHGGGGGTGGGGALYVHSGTTLTLSATSLINNEAQGGNGGAGNATGGSGAGGGGFGGGSGGIALIANGSGGGAGGNAGGTNGGTAGGVGLPNTFQNYGGAGGGGERPGVARAGGSNASDPATSGGAGVGQGGGGGGGAGAGGSAGNGITGVGGAGGLGFGVDYSYGVGGAGGGANGGADGFGASGGGGGSFGPGGDGGSLGGGGGASPGVAGNGGFGAGGGGGGVTGGVDVFGLGGSGGSSTPAGGGGGSGLGGAIYIQETALLILQDGVSFSGNSVIAGLGGANGGGNGSALGADIFIQSGGSIDFQVNQSVNVPNPIMGGGSLLISGAGTVSLNGANTLPGGILVQSGTLNLNGSVLGDLMVAGTFSGNATVFGTLTNAGTLRPGNFSIGTMHANAIYLDPTSVYQVEINSSGANDEIFAVGSAHVDGEVLVIPDDLNFTVPVTYTIVSTGTGVSGRFSSLSSTAPALMELIYHPLNVQLTFLPLSVVPLKGNALQAARCFGTLPVVGDVAVADAALLPLSFGELQVAFNQMGPAQFLDLLQVQMLDAFLVRSSYTRHLQESTCCGISLWSDVIGQWQNQSRTRELFGYDDSTVGVTIGSDCCYRNFVLGAAFSYTYDDLTWNQSAGRANINSYYGGLYGLWQADSFYINASFLATIHQGRTLRHLHFGTLDRQAVAKPNGTEVLGNLGFGYKVCGCNFQWTPYVNFDYVNLQESRFGENGAGSLDLLVRAKNTELMQGEFGFILSTCYGPLKPTLQLAYIGQTTFATPDYTASFVNSSCIFLGTGRSFERNLFAPRLSLAYESDLIEASVYYEAEVGRKYWAQDVGLTLTVCF